MKTNKKSARKKVGLALGGGAARGMAHIGVLKVLDEEGIPVNVIAGVSAGALVGGLYAQGKSGEKIHEIATTVKLRQLLSLVDVSLPRTGLLRGKKLAEMLLSVLDGDIDFNQLKIPFACIGTDIMTGEEVVINKGSVLTAIRASISVPGVLSVVQWNNRYLVDGALVNPIPVHVVREMGADYIIAVNVLPDLKSKAAQRNLKKPNIITVIMQALQISVNSLIETSKEGADIVIHPDVAHIFPGDFRPDHIEECVKQGIAAARTAIPDIKRQLGLVKA